MDLLKNRVSAPTATIVEEIPPVYDEVVEEVEEVATEEVTNFAEIIPVEQSGYRDEKQFPDEKLNAESGLASLTQDQLFEKLQNYKKLLDNGLILQGEYDKLKNEILSYL